MNLNELNTASFDGIIFYVKSATTNGGRKQIKHEYPNSPKQKIQDLGFMPRNFRFEAVIAAVYDSSGNEISSYRNNRDALLRALEGGGNKTLSHPFFDASIQVTARPYSLVEDIANLGRADISLEFDYSDIKSVPKAAATSASQVYAAKQTAIVAISDSAAANIITSTVDSYNAALSTVNEFTSDVLSTVQSWQTTSGFAEFSASINTLVSTASTLVTTPSSLMTSVMDIMSSISGLYGSQFSAISVLQNLFSFGDDFVYKNETTYQRMQANDAKLALAQSVQAASLCEAYNSAAQIDYTTANEIETVQAILEEQFAIVSSFAGQEVLDAVTTVRQLTNFFLETEKLNEGRLVDVTTPTLPASIIAFRYYGYAEDVYEKSSLIVDINSPSSNDVCFISGDIQVIV